MRLQGKATFDAETFLAEPGVGRSVLDVAKKRTIFTQGTRGNAIFYIQSGRVKLTVVSEKGKEATIALLGTGDFLGEECITAPETVYLATATALSQCCVLRIERKDMIRT